METNNATSQPDANGNDTHHGRAAFGTGSTTGGGSNYGQGSHDTGGSPYRQGTVQDDGANYESEADRLGDSSTGTRAEGSQSPDTGAPQPNGAAAAASDTGGPAHRERVNLAEDDVDADNRKDQKAEVDTKKGE